MIRKLPTIRDVAKQAGISLTSASYIINNKPGHKFAPTTVRKVREAVDALGYTPNKMIEAIHKGKTNTIGLGNILPGVTHEKTLAGIYSKMNELKSYDMLFYFSVGSQNKDKKVFLDGRADGVIFSEEANVQISSYLAQKGLPVVVLYKKNVDAGVACSRADDFSAGAMAVNCLCEKGHRKIAHLAGHLEDWEDAQERLAGYKYALKSNGITDIPQEWIFIRNNWKDDKCAEALKHWMTLPAEIRPTALFSANDAGAYGLMREAEKIGLKIPEDISIVGCDNNGNGDGKEAFLTTIDLNMFRVGEYAVQSIVDIVEGKKSPEDCRMPVKPELIERKTVKSINMEKK